MCVSVCLSLSHIYIYFFLPSYMCSGHEKIYLLLWIIEWSLKTTDFPGRIGQCTFEEPGKNSSKLQEQHKVGTPKMFTEAAHATRL